MTRSSHHEPSTSAPQPPARHLTGSRSAVAAEPARHERVILQLIIGAQVASALVILGLVFFAAKALSSHPTERVGLRLHHQPRLQAGIGPSHAEAVTVRATGLGEDPSTGPTRQPTTTAALPMVPAPSTEPLASRPAADLLPHAPADLASPWTVDRDGQVRWQRD